MEARQDYDLLEGAKPFQASEPTHVPHRTLCTVATSGQQSSELGSLASCTAGDVPVLHALSTSVDITHQQSTRPQDRQERPPVDVAITDCRRKASLSTHIHIGTTMEEEVSPLPNHANTDLQAPSLAFATPPAPTQSPSATPITTSAYPRARSAEVGGTHRAVAATRRSRGGARRRLGRRRGSI